MRLYFKRIVPIAGGECELDFRVAGVGKGGWRIWLKALGGMGCDRGLAVGLFVVGP